MFIKIRIKTEEFEQMSEHERETFVVSVIDASKKCIHIVHFESRRLIDWILMNVSLPVSYKSHLLLIKNSHAELSSLGRDAKVRLDVNFNGYLSSIEENRKWEIGYSSLLNGNYLREPEFFVENIENDGKMYELILNISEKKFRQKYKYGILLIFKYNFNNGAGDTSAYVFEYLIKLKKIVVCICDTDFLVPNGNTQKSTLDKVNEKAALLNCIFVGMIHPTPCRELENFLPLDIILNITDKENNGNAIKLKNLIEKEDNIELDESLWWYFDVKSGISIKNIEKACENSGQYAKQKEWFFKKYCLNEQKFKNFRMSGFIPRSSKGKSKQNIIKEFFSRENYESELSKHIYSPNWTEHFDEWIEYLHWFSVCNRKRRVQQGLPRQCLYEGAIVGSRATRFSQLT